MNEHDALIKETLKLANENGQMLSKIDALHRMVDNADAEAEDSYVVSKIPTSIVRELFGWGVCDRAKNARIEREARLERYRRSQYAGVDG